MKHERNVARAFTLVELLVVITIIALLIGILLPAMARAKEMTHRTICMVNLQQTGQGTASYVVDYKNWTPNSPRLNNYDAQNPGYASQYATRNVTHKQSATPYQYLAGVVPPIANEFGPEVTGKLLERQYMALNPKAFFCPSREEGDRYSQTSPPIYIGLPFNRKSWDSLLASTSNAISLGYSYNHRLQMRIDINEPLATHPSFRPIKPNQIIYGADIGIIDTGPLGTQIPYGSPKCHQDDYYNCVFLDMSVRPVIDVQKRLSNPPIPSGSAYRNAPGTVLSLLQDPTYPTAPY